MLCRPYYVIFMLCYVCYIMCYAMLCFMLRYVLSNEWNTITCQIKLCSSSYYPSEMRLFNPVVPNRGAHPPPGVNRSKLGMRKDPGGREVNGKSRGGDGELRGEWGWMFKSGVLIRWNCQFHLKKKNCYWRECWRTLRPKRLLADISFTYTRVWREACVAGHTRHAPPPLFLKTYTAHVFFI